jgi:enoyl-CoA hydratase/carnithine racemase
MAPSPAVVNDTPSLEFRGAAAVILFQRPREHNRIDPVDIDVLLSHLAQIEGHGDIRSVVFSALGDKTFSSGYTIQAIVHKLDRRFEDLLDTIENYPLPTICALNGSVYGGATDLALCCDFRIGVRGSRMFMPAAKFGLHYYPGGLRRYIAQLGLAEAKRFFLTAQTIEADHMLRIGFLTDLVKPEELWSKVDDYLEAIKLCEPLVLRSMKRQLNAIAADDPAAATVREDYERSLRSDELKRRLAAVTKSA